jgi:hypothetical protein
VSVSLTIFSAFCVPILPNFVAATLTDHVRHNTPAVPPRSGTCVYVRTEETSADDCCVTCGADPKCKAWEWSKKSSNSGHPGNCHLKVGPGSPERQPPTTCGVDPSLPPLPPSPGPTPPPPLPPPTPAPPGSPNIVFFLTDDQDQKLGGSFPQHGGVGSVVILSTLLQTCPPLLCCYVGADPLKPAPRGFHKLPPCLSCKERRKSS